MFLFFLVGGSKWLHWLQFFLFNNINGLRYFLVVTIWLQLVTILKKQVKSILLVVTILFSLLQKKGYNIFLKKIFIPLFLDYREYYENKKTETF
jgi:hypothetical protein